MRSGEIVARVSGKSKSDAELADELCTKVQFMHVAAHKLLAAIDRDAESEQTVNPEVYLAVESMAKRAVDVSLEIAHAHAEVFEPLVQLEAIAATSILIDIQVARAMADESARG